MNLAAALLREGRFFFADSHRAPEYPYPGKIALLMPEPASRLTDAGHVLRVRRSADAIAMGPACWFILKVNDG